jgi:hypothetical protein
MTNMNPNDSQKQGSHPGWVAIFALLVAVIALIVGEGIYQQLTGYSIFDIFHPAPTKTTGEFTVRVPSNILWYDTGIRVQTGQIITISASGNINTLPENGDSSSSGPDGQSTTCPDRNNPNVTNMQCPIDGQPYGILAGRIDNNQPFIVGSSFGTMLNKTGVLYLIINDNYTYYDNNTGYFEVKITLK